MKLKKLIPLVTATGITAIAAPLATSCSTLPEGWVDGKANLDTTGFTKYDGEFDKTFKEYTKNYLKQNSSIIADDYAYSMTQLYKLSNTLKINVGEKAKITEFEFRTVQAKLSDFKDESTKVDDVELMQASYTVEAKADLRIVANIDDLLGYLEKAISIKLPELGDITLDLQLAAKFKFTKVPVAIDWDYIRTTQSPINWITHKIVGLGFMIDAEQMFKKSSKYTDWQVEAWLSTKGHVTNDDIYLDLGIEMPEDKSLKVVKDDISQLRLPEALEVVLGVASMVCCGWSTYYYSDYDSTNLDSVMEVK